MSSDDSLEFWPRTRFTPLPLRSLFYYVLYGTIDEILPDIPTQTYRSLGIPEGLKLNYYKQDTNPEMWEQFQVGEIWKELQSKQSKLANSIEQAPHCIILQGELADTDNLDSLRDVIGLITYLFDCGATAVYDVLTESWFDLLRWRTSVFDRGIEAIASMVAIEAEFESTTLSSNEPNSATPQLHWLYTRGLRKFARPDISVRQVPTDQMASVNQVIDFLVSSMIDGVVIPHQQQLNFPELGLRIITRLTGELSEPVFHNFVLELDTQKL